MQVFDVSHNLSAEALQWHITPGICIHGCLRDLGKVACSPVDVLCIHRVGLPQWPVWCGDNEVWQQYACGPTGQRPLLELAGHQGEVRPAHVQRERQALHEEQQQ